MACPSTRASAAISHSLRCRSYAPVITREHSLPSELGALTSAAKTTHNEKTLGAGKAPAESLLTALPMTCYAPCGSCSYRYYTTLGPLAGRAHIRCATSNCRTGFCFKPPGTTRKANKPDSGACVRMSLVRASVFSCVSCCSP